jgi:hypothetical protein
MKTILKLLHVGFLLATFVSTSSLLYRLLTSREHTKDIFVVVIVFAFMSLLTSKYTLNE